MNDNSDDEAEDFQLLTHPFNRVDDNIAQSFQLESSFLRGRITRLGPVLDDILAPHKYPEPVAHLVAETITLAVLLSSMLKYEGIFTLQTKGDGPISMLVADVTTSGDVRGCASFDPEKLEKAQAGTGKQTYLERYLGGGYIAFTVDQGPNTARYQGIVELKGASLVESVQHYFNQSEQIGTAIQMAVGRHGKAWRAGGIMLQHMPEEDKIPEAKLSGARDEDWNRATMLLGTCKANELLDPHLHSNHLLTRLFHEEGVRVYKPKALTKGCRCDEKRVEGIISMMSVEDIEYMTVDGRIVMHCEFCSRDFVFDHDKIRSKIPGHGKETSE